MERKGKFDPNPFDHDELDDAVIAADDTGMLATERTITEVELEEAQEGDSDEGEV